jgi:hypothetical protein
MDPPNIRCSNRWAKPVRADSSSLAPYVIHNIHDGHGGRQVLVHDDTKTVIQNKFFKLYHVFIIVIMENSPGTGTFERKVKILKIMAGKGSRRPDQYILFTRNS